jgi:hypothetical protein
MTPLKSCCSEGNVLKTYDKTTIFFRKSLAAKGTDYFYIWQPEIPLSCQTGVYTERFKALVQYLMKDVRQIISELPFLR